MMKDTNKKWTEKHFGQKLDFINVIARNSNSYLCPGLWKMFQKYDASIVLLEQAAKIL